MNMHANASASSTTIALKLSEKFRRFVIIHPFIRAGSITKIIILFIHTESKDLPFTATFKMNAL